MSVETAPLPNRPQRRNSGNQSQPSKYQARLESSQDRQSVGQTNNRRPSHTIDALATHYVLKLDTSNHELHQSN